MPKGKTLEGPLDSKEIKPVNTNGNQPWIFIGRTDAETPVLWPLDEKNPLNGRLWCSERLRAGGEGGDRGGDGWVASPIQWTWVWANSGRWWRTGKPGVLQFMRSQRVGHDWMTERQQSGQGRMRWGNSRARGEDKTMRSRWPGRIRQVSLQEGRTWGTWPQSFW